MSAAELPMTFDDEHVAVFKLAGMAGCSHGASLSSPGSIWLRRVGEAALEAWTWATDHDELGELLEDGSHEVADGAVPIYTHDLWRVFTDLGGWQTDTSDYWPSIGATDDPMTKGVESALYVIARTLVDALFADWAGEDEQ